MLKEIQTDLYNRSLQFITTPDPETLSLFENSPNSLLDKLFKNDIDRVFLLEETGFSMDMQVLRWITKYKKAIQDDSSLEEANREFINETVQDVVGFYYEYLTRQDIFPIGVEIKTTDSGEKDVIATKYNQSLRDINKNLRTLTGQSERDGALEEGINKVIDIILKSEPDTIVVLNSPKGWSGLVRNGQEIIYPDNQSYVYWIDVEGNLQGITIRTDADLDSCENILGIDNNEALSIKERIKRVVASPLIKHGTSIEKILDVLEQSTGKKFEKQRKELANLDTLFELNGKADHIVQDLKESLRKNISHLSTDNIKVFVKIVGKAILDLYAYTSHKDKKYETGDQYYSRDLYNPETEYETRQIYHRLAYEVSKISGCNGGGNTNSDSSVENPGGINNLASSEVRILKCTCPFCGKKVNAEISCGKITCPECHRSAPYIC